MSQHNLMPEPPPMPPAKPAGPTKLHAKEDQLAQASAMLAARLFDHKSMNEVAAQFGVVRSTVSKRLRLARKEGIPEQARTIFIREALPAAMAVVLDSLKSPDERIRLSAAKMIIDGLEAMKLPEDEQAARKAGARDDDTYEVWREKIRITRTAIDRARHPGGQFAGNIIDIAPVEAAGEASDTPGDLPEPPEVQVREGQSERSGHAAEEDSARDGERGS